MLYFIEPKPINYMGLTCKHVQKRNTQVAIVQNNQDSWKNFILRQPYCFPTLASSFEMDFKTNTLKIMLYFIEPKPINYMGLTCKHVQKRNTQVAIVQNNQDSWKNFILRQPYCFPTLASSFEMDFKTNTLKIMLYFIEPKPINYMGLTCKHVQKRNTQVAIVQNNQDSWKNFILRQPYCFPTLASSFEMDFKTNTLKIMLYFIEPKPINYMGLTCKHVQKRNTQVAIVQNNQDSWKNFILSQPYCFPTLASSFEMDFKTNTLKIMLYFIESKPINYMGLTCKHVQTRNTQVAIMFKIIRIHGKTSF